MIQYYNTQVSKQSFFFFLQMQYTHKYITVTRNNTSTNFQPYNGSIINKWTPKEKKLPTIQIDFNQT